jgi:hypothetical protein
MQDAQRIVRIPQADSFYENQRSFPREPISSSDVYIESSTGLGGQQEAFTAELCINGVTVDASVQGRLIV